MLVMGMFNLIASLIGMRQTTTSGFHSDLNSRFFLIFLEGLKHSSLRLILKPYKSDSSSSRSCREGKAIGL